MLLQMAGRREEKQQKDESFRYDNHPSIHLPMHLQMAGRREVNRKKRMTLFIMIIIHHTHTHTHTQSMILGHSLLISLSYFK
jgi:hypothetical protein